MRVVAMGCLVGLLAWATACGGTSEGPVGGDVPVAGEVVEDSEAQADEAAEATDAPEAEGDDGLAGGDPGSEAGGEGVIIPMKEIRFASPAADATVQGTIRVEIQAADGGEWLVDEVVVALNGQPIFSDTKLPTHFLLDTREHPDGPAFLEAAARIQAELETSVASFTIANPPFAFLRAVTDKPVYRTGDIVRVEVDLGVSPVSLQADLSAMDSAFDPGLAQVSDRGDGTYLVTYTLSGANTRPDGVYAIPLLATSGAQTLTFGELRARLQNQPDPPLEVMGAIYVDEAPPAVVEDLSRAPSVTDLVGNDVVIAGGTASLTVQATDPQGNHEVVGVIVEVVGYRANGQAVPYHGYYQVPIELFPGSRDLKLLFSTVGRDESEYKDLDRLALRVSAIDPIGLRSASREHSLAINHQAASGEVQVSVSWDTESDVDLHVIEPKANGQPGGSEIYYSDRHGDLGGELDLDANAACSIDSPPVNNENVTWPEGQAPDGTYQVYLDYWDNCDVSGADSTHWIVSVKQCDTVKTWEGSFSSSDADMGSTCLPNGGCTFVTEFDSNCGGYVYGNVRYEDRSFDEQGFRARTWRPVRFARVEVRRQADNGLLATGYSDRHGHYAIRFGNIGPHGVYVRVFTQTNAEDGLREVAVRNHPKFGVVYAFTGPSFDESAAETKHLDLDIPEEDGFQALAGAFNIFDVAVSGHDLIRRMTGRDLGRLDLYWQTGADTTQTSYCSKKRYDDGLCSLLGTLSIQGREEDRDEYDDCVILQELFRFAHDQLSISDDPGGSADGVRDDPLRAWGNGSSLFFAADTLGIPFFLNRNRYGVYRYYDLEKMPSPFASGTSDGTPSGRVSEHLVAAVLHDLADGGPDDDDGVQAQGLGIYDSIFHYLRNPNLGGSDRGVVGRDLVDFLDGWFCRGHGHSDEVGAILGARAFPYDFQAPSSCL